MNDVLKLTCFNKERNNDTDNVFEFFKSFLRMKVHSLQLGGTYPKIWAEKKQNSLLIAVGEVGSILCVLAV